MVEEAVKISKDEDLEDFVTPDHEQLLQLREKYSILCLQVLGEYVEALGPVLHEKGVDVCLALLQRGIKDQEGCGHFALLHEILRLICALAAHRKFAALFVDRGGIQKILSVPRITQTYTALSACLFTFGSLQVNLETSTGWACCLLICYSFSLVAHLSFVAKHVFLCSLPWSVFVRFRLIHSTMWLN
jgi:HIV-1 Vpr-binding protein